jgi:SAM-dependent methyltransferase
VRLNEDHKGASEGGSGRWLEYWHTPDEIFVHPAHMKHHFQCLTEGFFRFAPQIRNGQLLDYGCGEALAAERFAADGLTILLYDKSDYYRRLISGRYNESERIKVLDDASLAALPDNSLNYILLCSVIQYFDDGELHALFRFAQTHLKRGGVLILADVPPPNTSVFRDIYELLRAALHGGYFLATLRSLAYLPFSNYRRTRNDSALRNFSESELRDQLAKFDFSTRVAERNFGWSRSRKTYLAEARPVFHGIDKK